jgi:hypothetical protein
MPPAHPQGPDKPSFWEFLLEVIDDDDRVERLTKLMTVVGRWALAAMLVLGAIFSVIYLGSQHLPLWSKIAMPSGGATLASVLYRVRRSRPRQPRQPRRSSGTRSLGERRSAGEIGQGPEGGERPPGAPGEQEGQDGSGSTPDADAGRPGEG